MSFEIYEIYEILLLYYIVSLIIISKLIGNLILSLCFAR